MARLFDGPELGSGPESFAAHMRRLGPVPAVGKNFIDVLATSGLSGRGGAGFPVATKWSAVARNSHGRATILVNGAEGEPQSKKDRALMSTRPHLILDGALIAARVLRARRIVLYIGETHSVARQIMLHALSERAPQDQRMVALAAAPARYVAGQESAAIHLVNEGVATPTTTPPYPFERGVDGAATLVQNVETLAHVALIARTGVATGTFLVTVAGGVATPGVLEIDGGLTVGQAIARAGGAVHPPRAVLLGGYFGSWIEPDKAWNLPLDGARLTEAGYGLGCGVVGVLPAGRCPVCETAGIMRYLASESSAQCGPCFFGLRALSDAVGRIAERGANAEDLHRLRRWAVEVRGRGACRHPDGAAIFLSSALDVFGHDFATHEPHGAPARIGAA